MLKQKNKKSEIGITLIALVVTIIVLIILAGVSIAMLVGENGIITQAQRAAQETEIKGDEEKIRLAMAAAQIANNGNTALKDDIEIALLENGTKSIVVDNEDGTRNIIFLDSKKIYKLNSDGSIEDTNSDFDSIYVAPDSQDEARNEGVIGIGTDGQPVDMDLWEYTLLEDGTYGLNDEETLNNEELGGTNSKDVRSKGYNGEYSENGEINGCIPQYISIDNRNTFIPITNMYATFFHDSNLKISPNIPSTVENMWNTFNTCINLVTAPEIPSNVTNMESTFFHCDNLEKSPTIPNNVITMKTTFQNCTSLTIAPEIPDSVTSLYGTFVGCTSLTVAPEIPDSVTNLYSTFGGCTSLTVAPEIPDSVTNLYSTFSGCTSLTVAPEIPNGVIDMFSTFRNCTSLTIAPTIPSSVKILVNTFRGCSNLQGTIEINANVTGIQLGEEYYNYKDYGNCLYDACTTTGLNLKVIGECTLLQEIVENANNSNITL